MMKLPYRKNAYIPKAKLTSYLLSETHSDGKQKSKLFRIFGFNETNIPVLEESLLKIAHTQEVRNTVESIHGTKYVIDGKIEAPNGRIINLKTIWIIEPNQKSPRFVTAYPV